MTQSPLPAVLKMLSECREDEKLVETVHLPIDPAKASEFGTLLDGSPTRCARRRGLWRSARMCHRLGRMNI